FYGKFASICKRVNLNHLIISSVKDALGSVLRVGYQIREGRKIPKIPANANVVMWKNFLEIGRNYHGKYRVKRTAKSPAVVLYSGGTTGVSKGILLSNLNFNALAMQTAEMAQCCVAGHSMLAVMPIFHGFGLGICIHMVLVNGCKCILIPRFNAASYAMLLKKKRPNYIAGVPTLYEAIIRNPDMNGVDLSCLEGVFSGGDSLSVELKKKFDAFLRNHNARVRVREGYGLTECVTASCLTPKDFEREGSIGLPFPDTFYKIVKFKTEETMPYGEEGEICISGPSVMLGYVNHPEETAQTLRTHEDGRVWLHTGDLGKMDEDGFVYYSQRIKRMIISSGYNIYPGQLENAIDEHDKVLLSCVIGVPDSYKGQKVKAFIVLRDSIEPSEKIRLELIEHCKKRIARYAMPYDIEFRAELPKTLVGKVNYRVLEEEELQKMGMGK
ncbi:MAG: AMP-binding protein, partial [Clostridia bacterium]|nr:AMP-binding protein [Clostridia bacterium]